MKSRTQVSLILVLLGLNFLFVIGPPTGVQGAYYQLHLNGCGYLRGTWDATNTICSVNEDVILTRDDDLDIPAGYVLRIVSGSLHAYGAIRNDGTIENRNYFLSSFLLFNYGIIYNDGTLVNGNIFDNYGEFHNNFDGEGVAIFETGDTTNNIAGAVIHNYNGGTLNNHDTINNYAHIYNNRLATMNIHWFLHNDGLISNEGTLNTYCTTQISGGGEITGNPTIYINLYEDENDPDSDSICDYIDNCPAVSNPDQMDSDGDGTGDVCEEPVGMSLFSNAVIMLSMGLLVGTLIVLRRRRNYPPTN